MPLPFGVSARETVRMMAPGRRRLRFGPPAGVGSWRRHGRVRRRAGHPATHPGRSVAGDVVLASLHADALEDQLVHELPVVVPFLGDRAAARGGVAGGREGHARAPGTAAACSRIARPASVTGSKQSLPCCRAWDELRTSPEVLELHLPRSGAGDVPPGCLLPDFAATSRSKIPTPSPRSVSSSISRWSGRDDPAGNHRPPRPA